MGDRCKWAALLWPAVSGWTSAASSLSNFAIKRQNPHILWAGVCVCVCCRGLSWNRDHAKWGEGSLWWSSCCNSAQLHLDFPPSHSKCYIYPAKEEFRPWRYSAQKRIIKPCDELAMKLNIAWEMNVLFLLCSGRFHEGDFASQRTKCNLSWIDPKMSTKCVTNLDDC